MPDDPNMVERVARAIYVGRNGPGCTAWGRQASAHKAPYLSDARAAIAAMREPTRKMLAYGEAITIAPWDGVAYQEIGFAAQEAWPAMIDAALNGK